MQSNIMITTRTKKRLFNISNLFHILSLTQVPAYITNCDSLSLSFFHFKSSCLSLSAAKYRKRAFSLLKVLEMNKMKMKKKKKTKTGEILWAVTTTASFQVILDRGPISHFRLPWNRKQGGERDLRRKKERFFAFGFAGKEQTISQQRAKENSSGGRFFRSWLYRFFTSHFQLAPPFPFSPLFITAVSILHYPTFKDIKVQLLCCFASPCFSAFLSFSTLFPHHGCTVATALTISATYFKQKEKGEKERKKCVLSSRQYPMKLNEFV